jgi:FkbM family methyltransferase
LPSWPDWPANRAITPEDARTHVTELAKLRIVDGRLRNADPDTLTHFQRCAREHATEVAQVREHLADDESRTVLDALVHGSIDDLFARYVDGLFRRVQYFDCGTLFPGMTICNGGIQEGFELPYFIAHTGGDAKIVCIDPGGFERLSAFSRPVVERFAAQFSVVPYALWSSAGDISLPITETGEVLSQLKGLDTPFREIVLPCRTLDEIVEEQQIAAVDLVKLDVEGAEPEVWAGMQQTLAHRPQIAISIYHWPRHFWEIPLALMDRLEDYDYYLRHYAYGRWECVLFAVPRPGTAPRLDAWRDRDRAA